MNNMNAIYKSYGNKPNCIKVIVLVYADLLNLIHSLALSPNPSV